MTFVYPSFSPVPFAPFGSVVHFAIRTLLNLLNLRQEREVSPCRSCRSCRFQRQTLKEGEKEIPKGETVSRGMQGQKD